MRPASHAPSALPSALATCVAPKIEPQCGPRKRSAIMAGTMNAVTE
jgi:hypothetical protein